MEGGRIWADGDTDGGRRVWGGRTRAESGSCGCTGSLPGMIPRANRYRLPHRKADDRIQRCASPVGTDARRLRVCSPGRPEKWISWGRSFFSGRAASPPGRRPPRIRRLRRMRRAAFAVYLRIMRKYDYRNPRTSRFTVPSWWIAQSNRISIVKPPPSALPSDSQNVNEHYRAVCYLALYTRNFSLYGRNFSR